MIKKIYSAENVDEVRAMIDKGLEVYGVLAGSKEKLERLEENADTVYLVERLAIAQTKDHIFPFISGRCYAGFFGLVKVIERVDVTKDVTEKVVKS